MTLYPVDPTCAYCGAVMVRLDPVDDTRHGSLDLRLATPPEWTCARECEDSKKLGQRLA